MFTIRAGLDCGVEVCEEPGWERIRCVTGVLGGRELGTLNAADRVCLRGVSGAASAIVSCVRREHVLTPQT